MKAFLKALVPSFKILWSDRITLMLTIVPILIGLLIYIYFGYAFLTSSFAWMESFIGGYLDADSTTASIIVNIIKAILIFLTYMIVNLTFVLFISVLASPFNDLLSARIEKIILGKDLLNFKESITNFNLNLTKVLFNEFKKISLIVILSVLSFIFAYIPVLTPISFFIAIILLSIEFLDYNWSRHNLSFGECLRNIKKNLGRYFCGGGFFFLIIAVPIVNLLVPAFATSLFTHLWVTNNEYSHSNS